MRYIILLPLALFASEVSVNVNKNILCKGERLIISITAHGKNIKIPTLEYISNYPVKQVFIENNIIAMNGKLEESITKTFVIIPDKNMTIPSFKVEVDNKLYITKPIKIIIQKPTSSHKGFIFDLNISKDSIYLGDSALISITIKSKKENVNFIKLPPFKIKNAILTPLQNNSKKNQATYKYIFHPLKSKTYTIGPIKAIVGIESIDKMKNRYFTFGIKTIKEKNIYSQTKTIKVYPIPKDTIFGDFNISLSIKNKKIEANSPNTATLRIKGCGDFYSLPNFSIKIPNATIYTTKPFLKTTFKNNHLCGIFEQNFTILAPHSYLIPPLTLKTFYNKKINLKTTSPIQVNVLSPTISSKEKIVYTKKYNLAFLILTFFAGAVIGTLVSYLIRKEDIFTKIKKAKSDKELLKILLSFKCYIKLQPYIEKLQSNIYNHTNYKIEKKEIIKTLKECLKHTL